MQRALPRLGPILVVLALAGCQAPDPRTLPRPGAAIPAEPRSLEEQVRELSAASRPGAMHQRLDALVGDWIVRLCEVAVDQGERELARGDARIEWVHERRFLAWRASLEIAGSTSGFLGYDQRSKQYQLLMISSLSSGMGVASGTGDLDDPGISFSQEILDAGTGARLRMTSILRSLGPDHFVLDAMGVDERGTERVVRRTHYERAVRR